MIIRYCYSRQGGGIDIDGHTIKTRAFADDMALMADTHEELQALLNNLRHISRHLKLQVSIAKTKYMIFEKK